MNSPSVQGGSSSLEKTTFITALLGAFFGGMLLNLMPCVFPVLGLKVMGFVMQAGSEPAKIPKTRYRIRVWTGRLHVDPGGRCSVRQAIVWRGD